MMSAVRKYWEIRFSTRNFLKLPQEKLDDMMRDTPEAILDIIVSVMESLCVKIGATEEEMQECVSRVRERRMGYLFENIEKMDIQAERRNTAEARAEARKAQEEAKRAREEAEKAREKARTEVEKAKREAEEKMLAETQENAIRSVIAVCRKLKASKAQAVQEVMEICGENEEAARKKVDLYWKA